VTDGPQPQQLPQQHQRQQAFFQIQPLDQVAQDRNHQKPYRQSPGHPLAPQQIGRQQQQKETTQGGKDMGFNARLNWNNIPNPGDAIGQPRRHRRLQVHQAH
jgi:hypothetical protein